MDATSLLAALDKDELTYEATMLMAWEMGTLDNIDDIAKFMVKGGPYPPQMSAKRPRRIQLSEEDPRPEKRLWDIVRKEMFLFICEDDPKYQALWKKLEEHSNKSTTALVAIIAAQLGEQIGVEKTLLTGFVALVLYGAVKVTKESVCEYLRQSST